MPKAAQPDVVEEVREPLPRVDADEDASIDGDPNWDLQVTHPADMVVKCPHDSDVPLFKARGYRECVEGKDGVNWRFNDVPRGGVGAVMKWKGDHTYMIAPKEMVERFERRQKAPNRKIRNEILSDRRRAYGGTIRIGQDGRAFDDNPLPVD